MSLQEPKDQFEREIEDSEEESAPVESPLSGSDTFASSDESESVVGLLGKEFEV